MKLISQLNCLCLFLLVAMTVQVKVVALRPACLHDISPCTCVENELVDIHLIRTINITCNGKDFQKGEELKSKLQLPQGSDINLFLHDVTFELPKGLIQPNGLHHLEFTCSNNTVRQDFIDFDTFQGLSSQAESVVIRKCNFTSTGFGFLIPFSLLRSFSMEDSEIKEFKSFPISRTLNTLILNNTSTEKLYFVSNTYELKKAALIRIDAKHIPSMLQDLLKVQNLTSLSLVSNGLESIPEQVIQFRALRHLEIAENPLKILKNGSLHFSHMPSKILLPMNQISEIESNAIQGNFSVLMDFDLRNNNLTQIKEDVFKPILNSMNRGSGRGMINLGGNNLQCGCDVRWLIQDNRHLLKHISNAMCFPNGRNLLTLESADFRNCPGGSASSADKTRINNLIGIIFAIFAIFANK